MRSVKSLLVAVMVLFLAAPLLAAEPGRKAKPKKEPKARPCPVAQMVQGVELTDAQKEQVAELKKKIADKMKEVQGLRAAAKLTPDQQKAMKEAREKAKADGKKGKELADAVKAAVQVTDEQKAAMDKAREAMKAIGQEVKAGVMEILTDEQKAALKKARGGKKDGPKPGKKGGAKANSTVAVVKPIDPRATLPITPKNLADTLADLEAVLAKLAPPPEPTLADLVDALIHIVFAADLPCGIGQEALRRIEDEFVDRNEFRVTEAFEVEQMLSDLDIPDLFERCRTVQQAVNQIYNNVVGDPRHTDVILIAYQKISELQFKEWAMRGTSIGLMGRILATNLKNKYGEENGDLKIPLDEHLTYALLYDVYVFLKENK